MRLFYFVHITGTDPGISGVPRVVKSLASELLATPEVELVPVSWSAELNALVHTEQKLLDNLARHGGPTLTASSEALAPIETQAGDWLLFAEVPHLGTHDAAYQPVLIEEPIAFARTRALRVAAVVHDIMPLTSSLGSERRRAFADLVRSDSGGDEAEVQRLRFALYAHGLARADLILPVSNTSGALLAQWLVAHGHAADKLPPISPNLLPEEIQGSPRALPCRPMPDARRTMEFLTVGTVCTHKNQLAAMAAFLRLIQRRPDLEVRLNVVGTVAPDVAVAASQLAKRSRGRIVLHGHLPDNRLDAMLKASRATVFISLAEGYGLPAAESLWRGKPCLCSNEGSLAEIAAKGGCLVVDPRDPDSIEAGLETLASDAERYDALLQEIAARRLRTWRDYARETVDRLAGAEGRLAESDGHGGSDSAAEAPFDAALTLASSDLSVLPAYASARPRSIRHRGILHYEREAHGAIGADTLFFGPYLWLPAGRHRITFDGEIDGQVEIALTADSGKTKLRWARLSTFARPLVIDLAEPVEGFEIVGRRTPGLERLVLRSALIEYRPLSPHDEPLPAAEFAEPPPLPVFGRNDDGRPLYFPHVVPASEMRVHDAYQVGARNQLRAGSTIAFRRRTHARVDVSTLFFGPYLELEPGAYWFRIQGDLDGQVRVRITQQFAAECLLETTLASFREPVRVELSSRATKIEIIADRLQDTQSLTLRGIEIVREAAQADEPPRPTSRPS